MEHSTEPEVSTPDSSRRAVAPLEDASNLGLREPDRVLGSGLVACHAREHREDDEGLEDLVDPRGGVARKADACGPVESRGELCVLARRLRLPAAREPSGAV